MTEHMHCDGEVRAGGVREYLAIYGGDGLIGEHDLGLFTPSQAGACVDSVHGSKVNNCGVIVSSRGRGYTRNDGSPIEMLEDKSIAVVQAPSDLAIAGMELRRGVGEQMRAEDQELVEALNDRSFAIASVVCDETDVLNARVELVLKGDIHALIVSEDNGGSLLWSSSRNRPMTATAEDVFGAQVDIAAVIDSVVAGFYQLSDDERVIIKKCLETGDMGVQAVRERADCVLRMFSTNRDDLSGLADSVFRTTLSMEDFGGRVLLLCNEGLHRIFSDWDIARMFRGGSNGDISKRIQHAVQLRHSNLSPELPPNSTKVCFPDGDGISIRSAVPRHWPRNLAFAWCRLPDMNTTLAGRF